MKLRKLFAGVAAAATLFGGLALGATTANAAEGDPSITVNNSQTDHTYTAYKFATFSNPTTANGKTTLDVATADGWNETLKSALDTAKLTPTGNDANVYQNNWAAYVATLTPSQLRQFADALVLTGKTADKTVDGTDGSAAKLENLAEGWYIVTDTKAGARGGATAIVASTLTDATAAKIALNTPDGQKDITAVGSFNSKGEDHVTPPPTKTADKTSVNVGDTVNYTITSKVPDVAAGYDSYAVTFKDVASKGLDVTTNPGFKVTVLEGNANGTDKDLTQTTDQAAGDYTLTQTGSAADANGTTTTIVVTNAKDYAGKTIQVTYTGTVTTDAVNEVTNTATVKNNSDTESEGKTVELPTAGFNFQKVNKDNTGLNGVTFNVYKDSVADANKLVFTKEADGKYVKAAADTKGATADLTTAKVGTADGSLYVRGLADGDYVVKETTPQAGYDKNFLAEFTVTVKNGVATIKQDNLHLVTPGAADASTATVLNVKSAAQLPLTGAAGTALFTMVGLLLAAAAITVYGKSRSTKRALRA
ncbi:hypothetical protein DSM100688_0825 [Bifidobacterium ramosum]|uniref:SpaH/EbpB family LPXTG-anchored major pilin n=1 Tax=Bifidobacterium ramosum TaxID=1798158 RepID=A0A6L4X0V3_9BIFI|nr:SpaH/EbpB family LPXTG-anchored major pilin [Bifidobacterium ramosum]KAB8288258.1 hypothetical protein DSM100688_0825 [Bifidobacterium ramosum]NEG71701.1 SpaH/EbpB family LPXTG-anchored major pilin [Bifidobacterium ramosum]